jgi:hypothetical protein
MNRNFKIYNMQTKQLLVQEIIDRMKAVLGFSKDDELANYLGKSRSTPAGWRTRGMVPIMEAIQIAEQHNISLDWLILKRGTGPELVGAEVEQTASAPTLDNVTDVPGYVDLPVLDMATFNSTSKDRAWKVPRLWLDQEGLTVEDTVMVRAVGDPMEPTIVDGEMVVVDRRVPNTDGVFLVRFGETVRFKRIQRMADGSIRLSNDNPAYTVDVIKKGDEDTIEIIGYCHASVRSVR